MCSNATTKNDLAFSIEMDLESHLNMTLKDFVVYPNIQEIMVAKTKVVKDNIGLYSHHYDQLFNGILHNLANDINMKYSKAGFPLSNINIVFSLLSGVLKNFTMTPYYFQNFMFLGFEMQDDLPTFDQQKEFFI